MKNRRFKDHHCGEVCESATYGTRQFCERTRKSCAYNTLWCDSLAATAILGPVLGLDWTAANRARLSRGLHRPYGPDCDIRQRKPDDCWRLLTVIGASGVVPLALVMIRLLLEADRVALRIELDHTVSLGVLNRIGRRRLYRWSEL
jgi:hypothetical protein